MRAVVQRVTRASVTVDGEKIAEIGGGLLVLLGVTHADTAADAGWLADKVGGLRIFADEDDIRAHGRDERILVKSFYDSIDFMYSVVTTLGSS